LVKKYFVAIPDESGKSVHQFIFQETGRAVPVGLGRPDGTFVQSVPGSIEKSGRLGAYRLFLIS
jgi:hypothetical protein